MFRNLPADVPKPPKLKELVPAVAFVLGVVNENAGGIDLIRDPNNAKTVYASTWERTRSAWNFVESGEGSNIYKSTDGGLSWTKMINKK